MTFTELQAVADNIRYKDWVLQVGVHSGVSRVQWLWPAKCVNTGEWCTQLGRKWDVTGMDEEAIVKTAFAAAIMAENHESAELFNYKGKRVFDPHRSVL